MGVTLVSRSTMALTCSRRLLGHNRRAEQRELCTCGRSNRAYQRHPRGTSELRDVHGQVHGIFVTPSQLNKLRLQSFQEQVLLRGRGTVTGLPKVRLDCHKS